MNNNMGDPQMINDLNDMYSRLHRDIDEWERLGEERAKAERDYRIKRKLMTLQHKSEGMAIGLIDKTTDGDVADLKMKVDVAEAKSNAALEHIRALKLEIQTLDARIQREWSSL